MQLWRQNLWFILEGNYCSQWHGLRFNQLESLANWCLWKSEDIKTDLIFILPYSLPTIFLSPLCYVFFFFLVGEWDGVGGVLWQNTTIFHPNLEQEPKGTTLNTTETTAHWYTHWVCQLHTNIGAVRPSLLMLHWSHIISFGCSSAPKAPTTFTAYKEGGKICPKSQNPFFLLPSVF